MASTYSDDILAASSSIGLVGADEVDSIDDRPCGRCTEELLDEDDVGDTTDNVDEVEALEELRGCLVVVLP